MPGKHNELYVEALGWIERPIVGARAEALSLLERATTREPEFALAHAMTAWVLARSVINTTYQTAATDRPAAEIQRLVSRSVERALALDPGLGRAYLPLADLYETSWRWSEAQLAYRRAEELTPNDPYVLYRFSWFSSFSGDHARAIELAERATRVQPDSYHGWLDLGVAHLCAGDPEAAAAALSRGAALAPGDSDVRFLLGVAEALLGRSAAALAQFQAVERLLGDDRFIAFLPKLAMGYSMLGRVTDVSRLLDELHARGRGIDIGAGPYALAHAAAGERERALEWLRAAVEKVGGGERDPGYYDLVHIMRNLYRQPIFDEPKFTELRRRLAATARAADVP